MLINDFKIKYMILLLQCFPFICIHEIKKMLDINLSDT